LVALNQLIYSESLTDYNPHPANALEKQRGNASSNTSKMLGKPLTTFIAKKKHVMKESIRFARVWSALRKFHKSWKHFKENNRLQCKNTRIKRYFFFTFASVFTGMSSLC